MQDRFKFRVWDKEKRQYNNGMLIFDYMRGILDPEKYILEQCTVLKDKNGNLIYEGDILKNHREEVGYVSFYQDTASMVILDKNGLIDDIIEKKYLGINFEIIGNIHENPELLEKD